MKFKQKKDKKQLQISIIIIILIAVVFVWSDFLLSSVNNILSPIRLSVYKTTDNVQSFLYTFSDIKRIKKENQELNVKLEKQKQLSFENKDLVKENKSLRKSLGIKERAEYDIVIAQISYVDALNPYETISIDKGLNDGIDINMAVISNFGVIGRIKEVFDDHSVAELITSAKSYTSAINEKGDTLAILNGQGNEMLDLKYIVNDSEVNVGDKIYTSGVSNIYLKDLYLGEVVSMTNDEDGMFKEVEVKIPYNIFNLKDVMIIKKEK